MKRKSTDSVGTDQFIEYLSSNKIYFRVRVLNQIAGLLHLKRLSLHVVRLHTESSSIKLVPSSKPNFTFLSSCSTFTNSSRIQHFNVAVSLYLHCHRYLLADVLHGLILLKMTSCIFLLCLCFSTDACTNTPVRKSCSSMQYKYKALLCQ